MKFSTNRLPDFNDSRESKPTAVVYNRESKLCALFNTEDLCSGYRCSGELEKIICRKLNFPSLLLAES